MEFNIRSILFSFLFALPTFAQAPVLPPVEKAPFEEGTEINAALDIGSSSTKLRVYRVQTDLQTLEGDFLLDRVIDVPFEATLASEINPEGKSGQYLTDETVQKGIEAIGALAEQAKQKGAKKITGVMTGPFRKALNAEEVRKRISAATGVQLQIIPQVSKSNEPSEASIGFLAAVAKLRLGNVKILVVDVGGSTFQITSLDRNRTVRTTSQKSTLAAKAFGASLHADGQLNPLSYSEFEKMIAEFKTWPVGDDHSGIQKYVGIGSFYNLGMKRFGKSITAQQLRDEATRLFDKYGGRPTLDNLKIEFPNDKYVEQKLSDLALAIAIQEKFNIEKLEVLNVNLADGVVLDSRLYEKK